MFQNFDSTGIIKTQPKISFSSASNKMKNAFENTVDTYAMSRKVNFLLVQRLIFVSTAYLGPMEPISGNVKFGTPARFQSY